MKYLFILCFSLSAQHTILFEFTEGVVQTKSTVYLMDHYAISISDKMSQFYNSKTDELYKIDFSKKKLLKQSFKKVKKLKSVISPFLSGNKIREEALNKRHLNYKVLKRSVKNDSHAAKIDLELIVTKDNKTLASRLSPYMKKLRTLIPFDFPVKEDEVVLDMSFKWKLNSMAKMFLTGKNKRFIEMESRMKITHIKKGITNKNKLIEITKFSK